ncbi:MAG: hypothetical protein ACPLZG_11940 [Thermoproteota archaeon]|jgi:hypothetical protein
MTYISRLHWSFYIPLILSKPAHEDIVVLSSYVVNPKEDGLRETMGSFQGEIANYELTLQDGRRIHVREFNGYYTAHWDKYSPLMNPIKHLQYDAPDCWILLGALVGAFTGTLLCKRNRIAGAFLFGSIGSLITSLTLPREVYEPP